MATFNPDGKYQSFGYATTTTSAESVYTAPTGFAAILVPWIHISNDDGNGFNVTLEWTDTSASATYVLAYQQPVSANEQFTKELYLTIDPGDIIKVTGSVTGLDVVITVVELAGRKA